MTSMKIIQYLLTSTELQLQLLMVIVTASPLLASSPGPVLREKSFDHLPLDDVVFTGDLLQDVWARSRIDCSKKCVETEGCVMCTFHSSPPEGPSPGLCRLHNQLQNASDVKQSRPGARSVAYRRGCDEGYVLECDRCLKAVAVKVNYTTARQQCGEMGGRLVVTKSIKEFECMLSFANKSGLADTWVGADALGNTGAFRWNDGTLLPDNSSLWAGHEPNYLPRDQACARIPRSGSRQGYYDCSCDYVLNYLCQKDLM